MKTVGTILEEIIVDSELPEISFAYSQPLNYMDMKPSPTFVEVFEVVYEIKQGISEFESLYKFVGIRRRI